MSTEVAHSEMDTTGRVAEEIRALLGRRRMSGRELARQLDVSPSWVSYRLTGTQPIDVNDLAMIAKALGVRASEILARAERGEGYVSVSSGAGAVTVSGRVPWPDHPVLAGAMPISPRTRPGGPPPSPTRTFPTGR